MPGGEVPVQPLHADRVETAADAQEDRLAGLAVTAAGLELRDGSGTLLATAPGAFHEREWVFVAAGYDPGSGGATLYRGIRGRTIAETRAAVGAGADAAPGRIREVYAGATPDAQALFNGKISHRVLLNRPPRADELEELRAGDLPDPGATVVAWDFSRDQNSLRVPDRGPYRVAGRCVGMPTRAMTGPHWVKGSAWTSGWPRTSSPRSTSTRTTWRTPAGRPPSASRFPPT
ncbi:MAG: hypothetical protein GEV11_29230 [Streptosporangiales bacterium]|nr:hypothetical protein [Streptosporangiales bacterium]